MSTIKNLQIYLKFGHEKSEEKKGSHVEDPVEMQRNEICRWHLRHGRTRYETKEGESGYTDFDMFRVPKDEPEWVVVEPDHLDLQGSQFVRDNGCTIDGQGGM